MASNAAERWLSRAAVTPRSPSASSRSAVEGRSTPRQLLEQDENYAPGADAGAGARVGRYEPAPEHQHSGKASHGASHGNERLYDAYSQLHALAQDVDISLSAPAILVVGQQTDGKSALVEALMGFQFNHVGGGTKTRRPVQLQMSYNAACLQPRCYLLKESGVEEEMTLEDLQEHIEAENRRLEAEHGFWAREIVVKIEYKFCPNITIIDTPGLISAAPGRKGSSAQAASRAVEALVRSKMERRDFIILCLEDTSDWGNATTRRLVLQVDPELRRTVLVSTKLDTKIPTFSRAADVELFLGPGKSVLETSPLGGGPFFSSVPSGRVGLSRECLFRSNDQYRDAVTAQEAADLAALEARLCRQLVDGERCRVGVSQLRLFLEKLLQRRYLDNVPTILPVLEREHRNAQGKLQETVGELDGLDGERLRERGRAFYASFLSKIPLLIRGTMAAPPDRFGETLADEHVRGGSFVGGDGRPLQSHTAIPNSDMRLFGGAQYHRALEEYRLAVSAVRCPPVSREEIVNACGMDEVHDGVNYTRTACVIAVAKAREAFQPFIFQLGFRLAHIMRRLLPISMYMLQREGRFLNGHDLFIKRIGATWHAFVDRTVRECQAKCLEDLASTTDFVTWSLHAGNKQGLRSVLGAAPPTAASAVNCAAGAAIVPSQTEDGCVTELAEHGLWSRQLQGATQDVVGALVDQIFGGIREHFITSSELKSNTQFLMPCIHAFPSKLREEIESAMEEDLDSVFDVGAVRAALDARRAKLENELHQMERIQEKFHSIHSQLARMTGGADVAQGLATQGREAAAKRGEQPKEARTLRAVN